MGVVVLVDSWLPPPVLLSEAQTKPGAFVGERAYKHLERLTSLGPRVAGSYENEVRSVDLLVREIGFIKQFANPAHKITVDVQRVSGVMTPTSSDKVENTVYQAIVNIVVKLEAANNSSMQANGQALLVNAHFDSVIGSPGNGLFNLFTCCNLYPFICDLGASDNGVSVAVALEVLEVMSRSKEATRRPVIFLFNGAEEKGLLVRPSHAYRIY